MFVVTFNKYNSILPPVLHFLTNSDDQITYFYVMSMVWWSLCMVWQLLWYGMNGMVWYEWYGMVYGMVWMVWYGNCYGMVWMVWYDMAIPWYGIWYGMNGMVWCGHTMVWYGNGMNGMVWYGHTMAWYMVWYYIAMVWYDSTPGIISPIWTCKIRKFWQSCRLVELWKEVVDTLLICSQSISWVAPS